MKGNGTIDDKEEKILEDIAAWMEVNGEGIFDTRPWCIYGELALHRNSNTFGRSRIQRRQERTLHFCRHPVCEKREILVCPYHEMALRRKNTDKITGYRQSLLQRRNRKGRIIRRRKGKFRRTSKGLLIDLPKDKTPNPISLVLKITNR